MDAEGKLSLIATQMHLEPAEEVSALPSAPKAAPLPGLAEAVVPGPNDVAACGHSPAGLRAGV